MNLEDLHKLIEGGSSVLLLAAIIGGFRGWYVFRWVFDAQVLETERWRAMAFRVLNITEKSST